MEVSIINKINEGRMKKRPDVKVGDTVRLHVAIKEGDKERTQVFEGLVTALKGSGLDSTITVRKVSYGVGVERIFPLHADTLQKIEVVKRGKVRKSKLYYMKSRVGKRALKVSGVKDVYMTDEVEVPTTGAEEAEAVSEEVAAPVADEPAVEKAKEE